MTMTAEEQTSEVQHTIPLEGEDITPKKDGGVLKVKNGAWFGTQHLASWVVSWQLVYCSARLTLAIDSYAVAYTDFLKKNSTKANFNARNTL